MLKLSALGGAVLALFLVRLLQPAAELLFAAHMAQHLLLIAMVAPLLVLAGFEIRIPPLMGWGLFIGIFLFWHWPAFFRWAAREPFGELLELGSILAAACCFWSSLLLPGRLNDGARALMVMAAAILTDLPGVVMLFAPRAVCTMPAENAARFGLTPLSDQQLAGLLMWVPANLVFFGVATFLFARWIGAHHRVVTL
jgi:cytochrome c oxidase assembly factor CtaG